MNKKPPHEQDLSKEIGTISRKLSRDKKLKGKEGVTKIYRAISETAGVAGDQTLNDTSIVKTSSAIQSPEKSVVLGG